MIMFMKMETTGSMVMNYGVKCLHSSHPWMSHGNEIWNYFVHLLNEYTSVTYFEEGAYHGLTRNIDIQLWNGNIFS